MEFHQLHQKLMTLTRRKGSETNDLTTPAQYKKQTKCMRCGSTLENHWRLKCPARDDTGVICYKRGHFVKVCLSTPKKFGAIAADDPKEQDEIDSDDDGFFLEGIENWKHSPKTESLE